MRKYGRYLIPALAALALVFSLGFYAGKSASPEAITVRVQRQVQSPQTPEPSDAAPTDAPAEAAALEDGRIDLNLATKEQLMTLPGVGEVLAERILTYRQDVGNFVSTEQLMDVSGIGERKYAELAAFVCVGE